MENKIENEPKIYECKIKTTIVMKFENNALHLPALKAFVLDIRDAADKHGFQDKSFVKDE